MRWWAGRSDSSPVPVAEHRGDRSRASASVNHRDNQERIFVRRVGLETEFPGGEIRSPYSLTGKGSQATKGEENRFSHAAGGWWNVLCDERPDAGDVRSGFRMKDEPFARVHLGLGCKSASSRIRRSSKKASPSIGVTRPLLMSSYRLSRD